jgi:hypothetical protein
VEEAAGKGMSGWAEVTSGPFSLHTIQGGHLFVNDPEARGAFVSRVRHEIEAACAGEGGGDPSLGQEDAGMVWRDADAALTLDLRVSTAPASVLEYALIARQGVFPSEVLHGLAKAFEQVLHALCDSAESWQSPAHELLPAALPVPPYRLDTAATSACCSTGWSTLNSLFKSWIVFMAPWWWQRTPFGKPVE